MKTTKKILSAVLVLVMLLTAMPMAFAEGNTYQVGDIIQFGSYPQSEVKDEALIAELNALAPEWEEWTSYGYYSGDGGNYSSIAKGDWMHYTDVTYNGNKYRCVRISSYRPYHVWSRHNHTYQPDNGYNANTFYWFKYEPVDWIVLNPHAGLVLCETIIDSQSFSGMVYKDSNSDTYSDSSYRYYANSYSTSSIRQWLNDDFYNTAFTSGDKAKITTATLETTNDQIFLLSYDEVSNLDNSLRLAKGSDYAQSQGLYVYRSSGSPYNGNSDWLLRSPVKDSSAYTYNIKDYGAVSEYIVTATCQGVRPALKLKEVSEKDKSEHRYSSTITRNPTHLSEGVKTYTCECGHSYNEPIAKTTEHIFTSKITTPATHLKDGVKTFTCACGESYTEPVEKITEHTYTSEITKQPTHLAEGVERFTCECGESYTEPVAKTTEHTYTKEIITPATHLKEGVMTLTCACGEGYIISVDKIAEHTYNSEITSQPTHLSEGIRTYMCECGDSYTQPVAKLEEHTYNAIVTAPACTEEGYTTYTCECGDGYIADYVNAKGHNDKDDDTYCDGCGYQVREKTFFEKIADFFKNIFDKLFGWLK